MDKITLTEKFTHISDHWNPRIIAELNGQHVKLVKIKGEFIWHQHEHEDELFYVVAGRFRMEFRDKQVWLESGDMLVVPRGVEHRPVADEEADIMLFEPVGTLNTGSETTSERTRAELNRL